MDKTAKKVISVKLLTEEHVKSLESLEQLVGEDRSAAVRQAIRFYEQHLRRQKNRRKAAA